MSSKSNTRREKKTKPETQKAGGTCGLNPRNFPLPIQVYVDQDYAHTLSPKDQEWLAAFNDKFYGCDFRDEENGGAWSLDEKRKANRDKNDTRKDVFDVARANGLMARIDTRPGDRKSSETVIDPGSIPSLEDTDLSPTPEYLNSTEYKAALARFRSTLNPHKSNRVPAITPEFVRAETELKTVTPDQDPTHEQE